jgi:outer membrane receptor for Fe3+-dicitrate
MKQILTFVFALLVSAATFAQGTITGKLVDADSGDGLISASVVVDGTTKGTLSDYDGNFTISGVPAGSQTIVITYVGYATMKQTVEVKDGGSTNMGSIKVGSSAIGLEQVNVVASIAVDRKTPVAVSTIKAEQIQQLVGNQEFPEILRSTPSVYVTKSGGGFGDSRINVRGFDQTNTAVMINGIPVNDMENGAVYWSNWAGLTDIASSVQIQRGLGASKLAVPSVGGSINIITNPAEREAGGQVSLSAGNDGYQKYGLNLSTGLMDNGWAVTVQGSHTRGDGYVDGTQFRAYSYFGAVSKTFNKQHTIVLTGLGAPQWHNQRSLGNFDGVTLRNFVNESDSISNTNETGYNYNQGIRFNPLYGELNGEEFSWRKNFYHKPKFFVNHYWTISDKTSLKTSAYVSTGRGGGTGPRGRLSTPSRWRDTDTRLRDENGEVKWNSIVNYNQGTTLPADTASIGTKQPDANFDDGTQYTANSGSNGFIRRASMNSHNWYGILSTLTHEVNDNITLTAGIDGRYYQGIHYRRVENLLGNDAYLSRSDDNNPNNYITTASPADFGNFNDNSYKDGNNVINYWNDGLVSWVGAFGQMEYSTDKLSVFATLNGSNQGFKRVDYFNYFTEETRQAISDTISTMTKDAWLTANPSQASDWQNFLGGVVKAGANYNIDEQHNVFFNAGFTSRQPIFDNVFINFVNDINPNIENQTIGTVELGYGFRSKIARANVNLYSTNWGNRQFSRTIQNSLGQEVSYLFRNIEQLHQGIEFEGTITPIRQLSIDVMFSLNSWKYASDFTATGTNIETQQPEGELTIFAKGLEVGDAAQTTFRIAANYKPVKGLKIFASYYFADRLFADYDVTDTRFNNPELANVVQLPSFALVDAGLFYDFTVSGLDLSLGVNVNNVLNTTYIQELDTNIEDNPFTQNTNELYNNIGYFGFGRTWNTTLRVNF